ncbi:MAG: DUF1501 domain-containing protein [Bacteroidia bacterium]
MKRRDFLRLTGTLASAPLWLNAIPVQGFQSSKLLTALSCDDVQNRALVIIQMRGGNDGLNMVIPVDAYSTYANLRPDIRVQDSGSNAYIPLDSTLPLADQVGLNPAMTGVKALYDAGNAHIIQGVGYPTHNRSHFKSTDLMLTGGDGTPGNFNISDGWMGRYLQFCYDAIVGNPSPVLPDPVGIQLGNKKPSLGFHTSDEHAAAINLSGQDPAGYFTLISEVGLDPIANIPASDYGDMLDHIYGIEQDSQVYASRISGVFNNGRNSSSASYPNTYLANQLKTVARLLNGGSKTKVFLVDMTGFDTHVNQVQSGNTHLGNHANLLAQLSDGVKAFIDDLTAMGIEDRVMTVTFSEFGRKAFQNANFGTDHGTLAPMMVFGKGVSGGVSGTNLDLTNLNNGAPLNRQYDYREIFARLLKDWLGADDPTLLATGFLSHVSSAPELVDTSQKADTTCPVLPSSSNGLGDPNNPHVFNVAVPPAGTTFVLDEPLTEITDCDYVILAPGFLAEYGSNVRIHPMECSNPPASAAARIAAAENRSHPGQSATEEFEDLVIAKEEKGEQLSQLEAYPNPFSSYLNVSFKVNQADKDVEVAIVSQKGQVMDAQIMHSFYQDEYFTVRFDTQDLAAGTYILSFRTTSTRRALKVVKVN